VEKSLIPALLEDYDALSSVWVRKLVDIKRNCRNERTFHSLAARRLSGSVSRKHQSVCKYLLKSKLSVRSAKPIPI